MIDINKRCFSCVVVILLLLTVTSCSLFEKLSPSFEVTNLKCKNAAVYFDFYNDSSKIISSMQIFVSVRNKKTGEVVGPSTGMLSCDFKQEIQSHEKKEMMILFEDYLDTAEEDTPVLELISLVVNRIVYSDGTVWKDTFGLFDAVNTTGGSTSIKEVSHEEPATETETNTAPEPTADVDPTAAPDPVEVPSEEPAENPSEDPAPNDPAMDPEPVEGPQEDPAPTEEPIEDPETIVAPEPKKMTLLIYMAADNDLECYAIQNHKEMEHSDFENMKVLVLLDRAQDYDETNDAWTDTRLFE